MPRKIPGGKSDGIPDENAEGYLLTFPNPMNPLKSNFKDTGEDSGFHPEWNVSFLLSHEDSGAPDWIAANKAAIAPGRLGFGVLGRRVFRKNL